MRFPICEFFCLTPRMQRGLPVCIRGPVSGSLAESCVNQIFLDASVLTQQHQKTGKY